MLRTPLFHFLIFLCRPGSSFLVQFVVSEPEHVLVVHSKKVSKGSGARALPNLLLVGSRDSQPSLNTYYRPDKSFPLKMGGAYVCMAKGLSKGGDRRWPSSLNASNVMRKVKIKLRIRISAAK